MTIENECTLSFYKEVMPLDKKNKVFLVKHVTSSELYVKKLLAPYCEDIYSQLKEVNIAGVPRVFECINDENTLYVIEEYVHGRTLAKLFEENGKFSESDVRSIALHLCSILNNIHDMNPPIIHRDIKPSNLILTTDGLLKLIDFDAAKNYSDDKDQDTHLLGTANFAAPEQYGFGQSDNRTDIYGLGSTINYLLTGKYPSEEIYTGKLGPIIKKCLSLDVNNRYKTANELYLALDNLDLDEKKVTPSKLEPTPVDKTVLGDISKEAIGARRFLPVGFRTLSIFRVFISIFLYSIAAYMSIDLEEQTVIENIYFCSICLLSAAWFGNYLGIRNFIGNTTNNKIAQYMLILLFWFVAIFILLMFY